MLLLGVFIVFSAICTQRPACYVPTPSSQLRYGAPQSTWRPGAQTRETAPTTERPPLGSSRRPSGQLSSSVLRPFCAGIATSSGRERSRDGAALRLPGGAASLCGSRNWIVPMTQRPLISSLLGWPTSLWPGGHDSVLVSIELHAARRDVGARGHVKVRGGGQPKSAPSTVWP